MTWCEVLYLGGRETDLSFPELFWHAEGLTWTTKSALLPFSFSEICFLLGHMTIARECLLLALFFLLSSLFFFSLSFLNCLLSPSCSCFFHGLLSFLLTILYYTREWVQFNMCRDTFRLKMSALIKNWEVHLPSWNTSWLLSFVRGRIVSPPKSMCWSPNSQYLRL